MNNKVRNENTHKTDKEDLRMNIRRLRKFTVAVLTVALVLTSMTTVFAADPSPTVENADKAATLKDLGLYSGQDVNDPTVGLQDALTTQDSLIFISKLFGYYDDANALAADEVAEALVKFDDAASISDYAKNVVGYSAANGILSGSTNGGKFFVGAKDTATAERFATFILRGMGYTVADYRQAVAKLAETKGSKVDATLTGDLTRDDAIGIIYGVLKAEMASRKTVMDDILANKNNYELWKMTSKAELAAKLAEMRAHLAEMNTWIEELGLRQNNSSNSGSSGEDSGFKLEVVSIKALNPKQLVIEFNAIMDENSVQNEANYKINDKGTDEKTLTNTSCKLGDDKKTVTITLDSTVEDRLTNSSKAKVIVSKNIMTASKKNLGADKEFTVDVQDGILPTVKEVKAIGKYNVQITFSEPVYGGNNEPLNVSNFKVVGDKNTYNVQKAELNLDVINLELSSELKEEFITVTVNNAGPSEVYAIRDYAGHKVFKGDHEFKYAKDTSVAVVTVKSVKENKIVLEFSKPVKGSNIKLYLRYNEAYKAEATTNGYVDEITFTFDNLLPRTPYFIVCMVNSKTNGEEIRDGYGINVPDQTLTCEMTDDKTPPVVIGCEVYKDESIKIEFDEELRREVANNPTNYEVSRVSDNKKIPFTVAIDGSMKLVELKFNPKLEDNTEYELLIRRYEDIFGNRGEPDYRYTFRVDYTDSESVYIEEAQLIAKDKIKIVFNKEMEQFNRSDIVLTNLTTPGAIKIVRSGELTTNDEKSEVELFLDKELATDVTDGGGARIGITTSDTPKSVSVSGSKLKANYDKAPLDDKVAPEIVWWDHDNDQSTDDIAKILVDLDSITQGTTGSFTIFFSEDIKESPLTVDTFSVDGFTITGISAPMGTKTVVLTVEANYNQISGEPTVTQKSPIEDAVGNVLAEGSKWSYIRANTY